VQEQFGELDAQGEPLQAGSTPGAGAGAGAAAGTVGGNSAGILEVNPRELNAELELQRKFHLSRGRAGVASGRGPVSDVSRCWPLKEKFIGDRMLGSCLPALGHLLH
jgi:hypothetical protein